jgi:hypothetical protein
LGGSVAELGFHFSVAVIFSLEAIRVYLRLSASKIKFLIAAQPRCDLCG